MRLHEFNLAMLSKQGWKLVIDPSSLVAQIFKAKYYPHSSSFGIKSQLYLAEYLGNTRLNSKKWPIACGRWF